jgi:UDP-4-amino-4,6-dideoxy-N-acetyl-beta-L-altrosamine N-acetyltransferase
MTEPEGVRLRPLEFADGARVLAWRNLPDVARWMYTDHEITQPEHARWLAGALNDDSRRFWIIEVDGLPAGLASLTQIDREQGTAYCASYLADPSVRGRGIGSEAERLIIRQAFDRLGLRRLACEVLATNAPGIRVHERQGFRVEGRLRQHIRKGSDLVDVILMGLLREELAPDAEDRNGIDGPGR